MGQKIIVLVLGKSWSGALINYIGWPRFETLVLAIAGTECGSKATVEYGALMFLLWPKAHHIIKIIILICHLLPRPRGLCRLPFKAGSAQPLDAASRVGEQLRGGASKTDPPPDRPATGELRRAGSRLPA